MSSGDANGSGWYNLWASADTAATTPFFDKFGFHWLDFVDSFTWTFGWHQKEELAPESKSIHGKIGGKLKPPKLQLPRGYGKRVHTQRHEYAGPHYR